MTMTYVRTYKLTYAPTVPHEDRASLNTLLFKNNLRSCGDYSTDVNDEHYGMRTNISEKVTYIISMMGVDNALEFIYSSDANTALEQLNTAFPEETIGLTTQTVKTERDEEQSARGNYIVDGDIEYDLSTIPCMIMGEGLTLTVKFNPNWRDTQLTFITTWITDKVARKSAIERNCVDIPLALMGQIQADIEHCLIRSGYFLTTELEGAVIDCHFDAKSESRSECTPDIIEKVREAKRVAIAQETGELPLSTEEEE